MNLEVRIHSCCIGLHALLLCANRTLSSTHFNPFFLCLSLLLFLSVYPPPPSLCHTPTPLSLSLNLLPFVCLSDYNLFPLLPLSAYVFFFLSIPFLSLCPPSLSSSLSAVSKDFWSHWKSFQDQGIYVPTPVSLKQISVTHHRQPAIKNVYTHVGP